MLQTEFTFFLLETFEFIWFHSTNINQSLFLMTNSGSVSQHINVHSSDGDLHSTIKYVDGGGLMGHRIGAVSCLTFHPYRVCLAAGGMDSLISVFSSEKPKKYP